MNDSRPSPSRGFHSLRPARTWEEALPIGNGTLGALVMGEAKEETLILSHERLFFPAPPAPDGGAREPAELAPHLPRIRELLGEGRYADAARLAVSETRRQGGLGESLLPHSFHPAFDLLIGMGPQGGIRDYSRALDFETGEAAVRWTNKTGRFERRAFVSRADNALVVSIRGLDGVRARCTLMFAPRPAARDRFGSDRRFASGIRSVEIGAEEECAEGGRAAGGRMTYRSLYAAAPAGYEGAGRVVARGGTLAVQGNVVSVRDADEIVVLVRVHRLEDAAAPRIGALTRGLADLPADYETLLARHAAIHGEIFRRVSLCLCESEGRSASGRKPPACSTIVAQAAGLREQSRDLPAEELVERAAGGEVSPAFLEKAFDAGRYLVLSSCGEWPPNLQGLWTGIWATPWGGGYTLDANVQAALAPALSGNMPECLESLFRLVESLVPDWRTNARRLFGCRGVVSCSSTTGDSGLSLDYSEQWPLVFWAAGAGWLANFFFDYYLFTGDREFLARRVVPLLKDIALFYEDFLVEGADGKLRFIPSYSPENTPSNSDSQACVNATMDIAVAKEVLANLVAACETLGVEPENVARWRAAVAKMPEYAVNAEGALKEWAHPDLADQYAHRHVSHLYPVYPGLEADAAVNPALCEALRRACELRLAQDPKIHKGFGLYHLSMAASRLGRPDLAWAAVRQMAEQHYYANFAASHNYGRDIFNLDASGGFPAALIEMLVVSRPGRIDLLAGLPEELPKGALRGVLCRGRVRIGSLEWDMEACEIVATLRSEIDQTVALRLPRAIVSAKDRQARADLAESRLGPDRLEIPLRAQRDATIEVVLQRASEPPTR